MSGPSIQDVVMEHVNNPATPPPEALIAALVEREEALADVLRMAGVQFGLYPQIVAEVLAEIQMGQPITEAQRSMIRQQFEALMIELQRAHESGGEPPSPSGPPPTN